MANTMWLALNGQAQGLPAHRDQIMVMTVNHGMSRVQNVNHQCLTFIKPVDKSSPLLGKAITDNEILSCEFSFYRTSPAGLNECYYVLKLINARISSIHLQVPHTIDDSAGQPEEIIELSYESISWEHLIAGTSAYSLWDERIF
ncbi:Hcp family type VI secretion system effector [Citrobacter freundii]|uniref:Hcp family type VI secretion system effector n=1 Tax=Citrobacter freundii TaxID=546 RepID=UPI000FDB112D|nr:Hcp family type VI secretion system effector [Citrobacter freundii]RVR86672.1 Hcp family type VI secretion system effector [Citrobacter freundii]